MWYKDFLLDKFSVCVCDLHALYLPLVKGIVKTGGSTKDLKIRSFFAKLTAFMEILVS